jgi:hypothetical protein
MMDQIMAPIDPLLLVVEVSDIGHPHPISVMLMGSHLTSEDAPGTLNGCCNPACRLLPTFAATKNNDEEAKSENKLSILPE